MKENNMDFEEISKMAYKKEHLNNNSTPLEQLIWYKMRELYKDYAMHNLSFEESQQKKIKIGAYYRQQIRIQQFDKELHDQRYKNIRESELMLKEILKDIESKKPEKEITKELIEYVVKITGIVPIKTEFENNYEVN